jgi:hypothetical protein
MAKRQKSRRRRRKIRTKIAKNVIRLYKNTCYFISSRETREKSEEGKEEEKE